MTGTTDMGTPEDDGGYDESDDRPTEQAYQPPHIDRLRGRARFGRFLSLDGEAEVGRGVHDVVNYVTLVGVPLAAVVVVVILCLVTGAAGVVTFGTGIAMFVVTLAVGLWLALRTAR